MAVKKVAVEYRDLVLGIWHSRMVHEGSVAHKALEGDPQYKDLLACYRYRPSEEDRAFLTIIETEQFDQLDQDERESLLLAVAQRCIQWVQDRKAY